MPFEPDNDRVTDDAPTGVHTFRDPAITPGVRVRLDGAPPNTTLTTPLGTVISEDKWDTYIVHLDTPAIYRNDDGTEQRLAEVRVLRFNLTPIT
ncbi:MAG: hypothetical protein ACYDAR_00560 [Thermomicrobiales bacterium]